MEWFEDVDVTRNLDEELALEVELNEVTGPMDDLHEAPGWED